MTGKADFTEQEWETVLEAPTSAGLIVSTAQRGRSFAREADSLLEAKASPEEIDDCRRFTLSHAERVAKAKEEGDQPVSNAERAAIEEIAAALGEDSG